VAISAAISVAAAAEEEEEEAVGSKEVEDAALDDNEVSSPR
jgi:hypothetical protein